MGFISFATEIYEFATNFSYLGAKKQLNFFLISSPEKGEKKNKTRGKKTGQEREM